MNANDHDRIAAELEAIGTNAVLAKKDAKKSARVNHRDNFALVFAWVANDAMLDVLLARLEDRTKLAIPYADWFNHVCSTNAPGSRLSRFEFLARTAAAKAYDQLQNGKPR